ncbi:hypothetical protein L596_013730 [Steinernema carpocapsae]|uniref:Uncharacterized protein n=1 Tax=Steinernema carpocapsae TaxID=34508 RepID=A0A4U5P247_STECR|nr:hypothetical protein L596_013730 [Steinernema carpocapsae]
MNDMVHLKDTDTTFHDLISSWCLAHMLSLAVKPKKSALKPSTSSEINYYKHCAEMYICVCGHAFEISLEFLRLHCTATYGVARMDSEKVE